MMRTLAILGFCLLSAMYSLAGNAVVSAIYLATAAVCFFLDSDKGRPA